MSKNNHKKRDLVKEYIGLADTINDIGEYVKALEFLPPRGEGARSAVEEEVLEVFDKAFKRLNFLKQGLKKKIWEGFEE